MEVPIQVAVRLCPPNQDNDTQWLSTDSISHSVITSNGQAFKVDNALPMGCSQHQVYSSIIPVQINSILDGCDTSIVVLGQKKTGKTYTLMGPSAEAMMDQEESGLIPRFIKEVFVRVSERPERSYTVHITWMKLVNGSVIDLLECGLVQCNSSHDVLQLLQRGMTRNTQEPSHTVFTVTIQQRWIGVGGVLQHKLSTASFCELSAYPEPSLNALEDVVKCLLQLSNNNVDYQQSLLTTMLRDSFGGRAFTWIICCINPSITYAEDSQKNLEFCWCCRGIKNYVTVNGYADNNTCVLNAKESFSKPPDEIFALKFAAQQWVKLVISAEGLFHKLVQSGTRSQAEVGEINEWLFLKAECDECFNSNEEAASVSAHDIVESDLGGGSCKKTLPRISEDTEPSELSDVHSESDTSLEHDQFLFNDKLYKYIEYFEEKSDELALDRCEEYLHSDEKKMKGECVERFTEESRRRSLHPGQSLSKGELELLRSIASKAISPQSQQIILEAHKLHKNPESLLVQRELLKVIDSPVPSESNKKYKSLLQKYNCKQELVSKLCREIESGEKQLKELSSLCVAKEQLIYDLGKIIKRQGCVKQRTDNADGKQTKPGKGDVTTAQTQIKCIAGGGDSKEIKKHELKLKVYKKQVEQLKKHIKRDEKRKNTLELELIKDKSKLDEMYHLVGKAVESNDLQRSKEKPCLLSKCESSDDNTELMLRTEISNLRRTRECLIDRRCSLGQKRKTHRSLSDSEERKLLECEEAIEAIDTAIEHKNALICGKGLARDVMGVGADHHRDRGEEMLMARLSKLSDVEMRTLLYKYFQKVIDLRGTCASLEASNAVSQREAASWRRRCADAWTTLHHTRIMHHRRTTTLTARHYHTMNQLMREMTGDTDTDLDGVYNSNTICSQTSSNEGGPLPSLEYHHHNAHTLSGADNEHRFTRHRIAATTAKIKLKDNCAAPNTSLLNELQQLTRYHQTQNLGQMGISSSIPTHNLKHLQSSNNCSPLTRVTRQKNKLVIVQEDKPV